MLCGKQPLRACSVPSSRQGGQEKGHAVLLLLSPCLLAGNSWGSATTQAGCPVPAVGPACGSERSPKSSEGRRETDCADDRLSPDLTPSSTSSFRLALKPSHFPGALPAPQLHRGEAPSKPIAYLWRGRLHFPLLLLVLLVGPGIDHEHLQPSGEKREQSRSDPCSRRSGPCLVEWSKQVPCFTQWTGLRAPEHGQSLPLPGQRVPAAQPRTSTDCEDQARVLTLQRPQCRWPWEDVSATVAERQADHWHQSAGHVTVSISALPSVLRLASITTL